MKNKHSAVYGIIILLVVLAVVLGIGIYYQQNSQPTPSAEGNIEINEPFILPTAPGSDASEEEKSMFAQGIEKYATEANVIEIKEACSFSPEVIRIKEGDGLTFKNLDTLQHTIVIIDQYTIPAGGAHALSATFEKGPGIYGIGCDSTGTKGFLQVYAKSESL